MRKEVRLKIALAIGAIALLSVWTPLLLTYMFRSGSDAYDDRNYASSRRWFLLPALLGNNQCQTLLGSMYSMGQGGLQDATAAVYWLERAASANVTQAQTMLGALYSTGVVGQRDPEKAIFWLAKAAGRGDKDAIKMLGVYKLRHGAM